MEHRVEQTLRQAGDLSGAAAWRRASAELEQGLRIGIAGRDRALVDRVVKRITSAQPKVRFVDIAIELGDDDRATPILRGEDVLLGVHVLLWITGPPATLGQSERTALELLDGLGRPAARRLVLAELDLLQRISDAPEREAAEVRQRLDALAPPNWSVADESELCDFLGGLVLRDLTTARRVDAAKFLLQNAKKMAVDAETRESDQVARVAGLLDA